MLALVLCTVVELHALLRPLSNLRLPFFHSPRSSCYMLQLFAYNIRRLCRRYVSFSVSYYLPSYGGL
jgi:hypothetical protein